LHGSCDTAEYNKHMRVSEGRGGILTAINQEAPGGNNAVSYPEQQEHHHEDHGGPNTGLRKPDDAIYAHVERATGVPGGQIVFFDDVEENVEAARRRGWRACHVDPRPDDPLSQVRAFLAAQGIKL